LVVFIRNMCIAYSFDFVWLHFSGHVYCIHFVGADPGFQVRGGGTLKKIVPSGGRRENFWSISCEKSRFYAKKSYFSNFRGYIHDDHEDLINKHVMMIRVTDNI
jgi:hypothetical protein